MMQQQSQSLLSAANQAFRAGQSAAAMSGYIQAMLKMPELGQTISANLARTRQQYLASRAPGAPLQVVVCGWELARNAAGRAHTLAEIYREFAQVKIVGCLFPRWGREIWEPIRHTSIAIHPILVEDYNGFIEQALTLVAAHPADVAHLSKPRAPNILFGIFYKLLWGASVILDIDDEELAFVQADTALAFDQYLQQHSHLPTLSQIAGANWTRLAVGMAHDFDAITVSNVALQQRYGGDIIGHARNPNTLCPSATLREASRQALGIRPEQKVILFSGTPRPHKGLFEVARAIQRMHREDILFVIAGNFDAANLHLKVQLQGLEGVNYLFLENQPFDTLSRTLSIADCCVLLQDTHHPCTPFQIPAKLSDALAMGIPVIVTATAALADAIAAGAVIPATPEDLVTRLAATLDTPNAAAIEAGHRYFAEHLSLAANATILQGTLQYTRRNTRHDAFSPVLSQILARLAEQSPVLQSLHHLLMPPHSQPTAKQHLDVPIVPSGKLAIAVHVYYPELWPDIARRIKALDYPYLLDITTPPEQAAAVEQLVKQDFPAARIHVTPNWGMDIMPFLSLVPRWQQEGILVVCKLHTKKGDGGEIATQWRTHLLDTLAGHPETPRRIAQTFSAHPRLSLAGSAALYLSGQRLMYQNEPALTQLAQTLYHSPLPQNDWGLFAGTMFWARPDALAPLARLAAGVSPSRSRDHARDGQFEHALERIFGLIPHFSSGQIGLLTAPNNPADAPSLQIVEALAPATRQFINQSHASQAVRQTLDLIDWPAQRSKLRQDELVSIVIPIYNQPELTAACIASLYRHTAAERFELILVDNGSDTPTQTMLQRLAREHHNLRLLRNAENLNFALGCNLGFAASQGAIVVFLNNDTTVTPHWLPPLVEALRRFDIAVVQPKLLYPDGSIQCIGVVFSAKSPLGYPLYAGMKPDKPWASRSRAFQAVTGACMALRAADFADLHGFDPIYINGQEDIDLCLRLNASYNKSSGWLAAESVVIHHESKTPNRFKHVQSNRSTFVRRWAKQVMPDDLDYYATDGFSVTGYQPGSPKTLPPELQVYRPRLAPIDVHRSSVSADFQIQYF
jgi:GT2 family glycosyltransferase/glycosyltransferase involved in cell wall biosynthesis